MDIARKQESFLMAEMNAAAAFRESQEETRAFRHDIRNNLQALELMMKARKYDEAENYLSELSDEIGGFSPRFITGDDMLDTIISMKYREIEDLGIDFKIIGVIDGGIGWSPMDVCNVFANAFDNAIEAIASADSPDTKWIRLEFKKTKHNRLITLSNGCTPAEGMKAEYLLSPGFTTKKEKSDHGFGLYNIQKTVEKNNGIFKINPEEKSFTLEILVQT